MIEHSAAMSRRMVVGGALAALGTPAWAQLLDPSQLGAKGRSGAGLLDPGALAVPSAAPPRSSDPAPDHARGMASQAAGALPGLMGSFAALANRATQLHELEGQLAKQLADAKTNRESTLEEYRLGFFCTGCNRTRSDILAHGETFPHPGQSIRPATPEELAAEQAKLDAVVDGLAKRAADTQRDRGARERERDEALSQIYAGCDLWSAAGGLQERLVRRTATAAEADYRNQRAVAARALTTIGGATEHGGDAGFLARSLAEARGWSDLVDRIDAGREAAAAAQGQGLAAVDAAMAADRSRIVSAGQGAAGTIKDPIQRARLANQAYALSSLGKLTSGSPGTGARFRMGDFTPARAGEVLPAVGGFVGEMTATGEPAYQLPLDPEPLHRAARQLQASLAEKIKAVSPKDGGA